MDTRICDTNDGKAGKLIVRGAYPVIVAGLAFSLMLNRNVTPPGRTSRDELDDLAVMLARFTGRSAPP